MRDLVLEYYLAMRAMFSDRPHLRPCRVSCRHCGILFITYPCNQHRTNLGCPFGCREAHKRKSSNERVAAYYKTESGWKKKKALNSKRSKHAPKPNATEEQGKQTKSPEPAEPGTSCESEPETRADLEESDTRAVRPVQNPSIEAGTGAEGAGPAEEGTKSLPKAPAAEHEAERGGRVLEHGPIQFDAGMVKYVQLVTSLIEGRQVSRDEILQMLGRVMRQRSLDPERRVPYCVRRRNEKPP